MPSDPLHTGPPSPASMATWTSMTSEEVADLVARDPVAVLPLAATEQHGRHLPLSTDLEIGMGLLAEAFRRLPEGFPARLLPPQAVGASTEHLRFPGTLSLPPELLGRAIREVGRTLARHGIRRLVLGNSHGGNEPVLASAGLALREECGLLVVKASYFRFPRPSSVGLPEAEWRHGLHGGAVETAMMLHLRPDLVRTAKLRPEAGEGSAPSLGEELEETMRLVGPEAEAASFSWLAGDLSPEGTAGDPGLADAGMGARLVEHYGGLLADVIQDARTFPLERLR